MKNLTDLLKDESALDSQNVFKPAVETLRETYINSDLQKTKKVIYLTLAAYTAIM
jgi:hypothetical protein